MAAYKGEPGYAHGTRPCLGILLTNLGTPDAPTTREVRRYLGEFLFDPRVVELPRAIWWPILHGVILRIRPVRSARLYRRIWTQEGSPLLYIAKHQAEALQQSLDARFPGPVKVALGMRYGRPSIAAALEVLRRAHARRLLVFPLYPQYSATTTASTFDAVAEVLKTWRWLPELRMINHYHDDPGYIQALAQSVRQHWAQHGRAQRLLLSFHGIPKRYLLAGDPYHCECQATARQLATALGIAEQDWQLAFQSRFGREEWLKPYTDQTLQAWAQAGLRSVDVLCPGFSADCLETVDEIAEENRRVFLEAGGETYRYIPALNDSAAHIEALATLVAQHTQGWAETAPNWNGNHAAVQSATTRDRAVAMGATR